MNIPRLLLCCAVPLASVGGLANAAAPIEPVSYVDLSRFMGDWYVIATIPTRFEKNAYNAVETYELVDSGHVQTSFRFREGSFAAPVEQIHAMGYVQPGTGNAVWGIQLFWWFKAEYIVAYLSEDYSQTIVARNDRDYTWVMARTPAVSPADYAALLERVQALGYPLDKVRKVPQEWPETSQQTR